MRQGPLAYLTRPPASVITLPDSPSVVSSLFQSERLGVSRGGDWMLTQLDLAGQARFPLGRENALAPLTGVV